MQARLINSRLTPPELPGNTRDEAHYKSSKENIDSDLIAE
jgi:hypothetical protein